MWAIVPLKFFADAKSRLAPVLEPAERAALVRAMARDVLTALAATRTLAGIIIASREAEVPALAEQFGAEVFVEPPDADLSASVSAASQWAVEARSASGTLIVHADIPTATATAFDALLRAHRTLTLVPDDAGRGTNCIAASPPNPIEYRYDGNSFRPHLALARAAGIEPGICEIPELQLDIDTADDLRRLLALHPTGATGGFLARSAVASRLGSPHNEGSRSE